MIKYRWNLYTIVNLDWILIYPSINIWIETINYFFISRYIYSLKLFFLYIHLKYKFQRNFVSLYLNKTNLNLLIKETKYFICNKNIICFLN